MKQPIYKNLDPERYVSLAPSRTIYSKSFLLVNHHKEVKGGNKDSISKTIFQPYIHSKTDIYIIIHFPITTLPIITKLFRDTPRFSFKSVYKLMVPLYVTYTRVLYTLIPQLELRDYNSKVLNGRTR